MAAAVSLFDDKLRSAFSIHLRRSSSKRPGSGLPDAQPQISRLATYLILDRIQGTDPAQSFCGCWRCVNNMNLVELASGMCPTRGLVDVFSIQVMKACIGIRLKSALEGLQMLAGMFPLAIRRVRKPYGWRSLFTSRPVVANVCPEAARLGLAVAGSKNGHGRVVGVQLAAGENMLLNRVDKRTEQIAGARLPSRPEWSARSQLPAGHRSQTACKAEDDR